MGQPKSHQIVIPKFLNNLSNSFNHEKLSEMLDYIIKMPPTECSHDRGHKYPFTVSELFACEISQINELFFTAPPPQAPKKAAPIEKEVNSD
jgi:phosphatidylinositol kinase/protein kinase (PI-3  family)